MIKEKLEKMPKWLMIILSIAVNIIVVWDLGFNLSFVEAVAIGAVALTVFSAALLLRALAGVPVAFTTHVISIPASLYIATLSLIQAITFEQRFGGVFLAMMTGGLLFLSTMNEKVAGEDAFNNKISCWLVGVVVAFLPIFIFTPFYPNLLIALSMPGFVVSVFLSLATIYLLQDDSKSFNERLLFASAYNVVFQSLSAVMYFVWIVTNVEDFTTGVAAVSAQLVSPLMIYLAVLIHVIGAKKLGDVSKIDLTNWHIVEGFIFFMAMVVAPPSIIEFILSQQN